jgi:hypothetical protein
MASMRDEVRKLRAQATNASASIKLKNGDVFYFDLVRARQELFSFAAKCATADYARRPRPSLSEVPKVLEIVQQAADRTAAVALLYPTFLDAKAKPPSMGNQTAKATPFTAFDLRILAEGGALVPCLFASGYPPVEEAS